MFNNVFYNKKILITGHAGFKGSWLCFLLKQLGAKIYGYSLIPNEKPTLYHTLQIYNLLESEKIADISDTYHINEFFKQVNPDIVIHLAAQPLVIESYKDPIGTYQTNVIGTLNILEACKNAPNIKAVINITTDKCYENREDGSAYKETDAFGGYDMYSSSKACSEILTASYRRAFLTSNTQNHFLLASARAGNVIGGGDWAKDRLIPDCIRAFITKEKVLIRKPNANRPWQFVLEPLVGYLRIVQKLIEGDKECARGFNLGPDKTNIKSVFEVASLASKYWGNNAEVLIDEKADYHEATELQLDSSLAKKALDISPVWDVETAIKNTIFWYKEYYSNAEPISITNQIIDTFINDAKNKHLTWTE